MNMIFTSTVEYNDELNEYFITIPEDLLDHCGWEENDILEWSTNKDGTVLLERIDNEICE